jgi:serine protease Do
MIGRDRGLAGVVVLLGMAWARFALADGVGGLTPAQIVERASASVVVIKSGVGLGTGFVAGKEGRIATNLHVIAGGGTISVLLSSAPEREIKDLEVMGVDEAHDLAVLRAPGIDLAVLPLGDSERVRAGDRVVAIGHPLGLDHTVSDGLVSAVRRLSPTLTLLQVSAPISPGSSGGPLFNDRAEVIGISAAVSTEGQNLNFGIPVNVLKPLLAIERGVPISQWKPPARTDRRAPPRYDLGLLNGCPPDRTSTLARKIDDAIAVGAPLYNEHHEEACYRVYESTARELADKLAGCPGVQKTLRKGLQEADTARDYSAKAWVMRDTFDGLLDVMTRRAAAESSGRLPAPPARHVPHHPANLLADCAPPQIDKLGSSIEHAIEAGAPLYNDGQIEACFRIYEATAVALARSLAGCTGVKRALQGGIGESKHRHGATAKAWALRDSFDGLLQAIDGRRSAAPAP